MKILCVINGGMGDQILALPALKYLKKNLQKEEIEIRLGGWTARQKLYEILAGSSTRTLPLGELYSLPEQLRSSIAPDWILNMDIRTLPGKLPTWLKARLGYLSFWEEERVQNLTLLKPEGNLYWQHCFEMAFRFVCLLRNIQFSSLEMCDCRDGYRKSSIPSASEDTRKRLEGLMPLPTENRRLLAVTPGGYNPPHKVWPVQNFADVICHAAMRGIEVFVIGSQRELPLSGELHDLILQRLLSWREKAKGSVTFLTGKLGLEELPYLLAKIDLHVSNDNGVAQIGGAMNCRQIVLYRGSSSPHLTLGFRDQALFSGDEQRMNGISTDQVISLLDEMLP